MSTAPALLTAFAFLRRHLIPTISVSVLIVLIILGIVFHQQVKNQLNDWKLLPQPERLTELYFSNPNSLPSTYTPGQTQVISFTVHNLEYRTTDYPYKVIEQNQDDSQSAVLASGVFKLNQNNYKNERLTILLSDLGSRVKLVIALPQQGETIDYWVEENI